MSANRHFVVGEQEPEEAFTGAGGNEGQGRPLEFGDQLDGPNVLDGRINSAGPVTIAIDPDSEDIVEIRKNLSEIVRQVRSNNLFMVEGGDEAERNLMQLEAAIMLLKVREIDPNLWLGMVRPAFSYLSKKIAENALNYAIDVIIAATVSLAVRHFAG
ncbi:hypothetical protein VQ045_16640 [Aurantimonas sp. E1-2-R+4]|uniref:hypothetical protein n=1 Tax=Aurantimonas sp. E1-2-R+4 TaxID=3113714 RepID=UPI002F929E38